VSSSKRLFHGGSTRYDGGRIGSSTLIFRSAQCLVEQTEGRAEERAAGRDEGTEEGMERREEGMESREGKRRE